MTDYTKLTTEERVDLLGELKAQIASLEAKEDQLKKLLVCLLYTSPSPRDS